MPAFRYVERTYYDREGKVVRRDKDVIRKAKGGTQPDVLPLFDQMVNKTNEIVKACKKNQLERITHVTTVICLGLLFHIEKEHTSDDNSKKKV